MNAAELKLELDKLGWKFDSSWRTNAGVDWCACTTLEGALDCSSNLKPPSLTLTPWEYSDGGSVEFSVRGAVWNDMWLDLKLYSVKMDDALATIPQAKAIMLAAWNAAVESKAEKLCEDAKFS